MIYARPNDPIPKATAGFKIAFEPSPAARVAPRVSEPPMTKGALDSAFVESYERTIEAIPNVKIVAPINSAHIINQVKE